jgi:hypothetical protein
VDRSRGSSAPVAEAAQAPRVAGTVPGWPTDDGARTLLGAGYAAAARERWLDLQSTFVDDPEDAVRRATAVLDEAVAALTDAVESLRRIAAEKADGAEGTEDHRQALLHQREVIGRLLRM